MELPSATETASEKGFRKHYIPPPVRVYKKTPLEFVYNKDIPQSSCF